MPGYEESRIEQTPDGCRLAGELDVKETGVAAQLNYVIDCAPDWRTRRPLVTPRIGP